MIMMLTGVLHFSWGHTTESMCIGYLTSYHNEPTVSLRIVLPPCHMYYDLMCLQAKGSALSGRGFHLALLYTALIKIRYHTCIQIVIINSCCYDNHVDYDFQDGLP